MAFINELSRKRKAEEDPSIEELPLKKRGRPLLLGEKIDCMVQKYIKIREKSGSINTNIVIAGAKGILKTLNRTQLVEFGGHITLNKFGPDHF